MAIELPETAQRTMSLLNIKRFEMDWKSADVQNCPGCGKPLSHFEAADNRCSRCAMVDELIEELIRKQTRAQASERVGIRCY